MLRALRVSAMTTWSSKRNADKLTNGGKTASDLAIFRTGLLIATWMVVNNNQALRYQLEWPVRRPREGETQRRSEDPLRTEEVTQQPILRIQKQDAEVLDRKVGHASSIPASWCQRDKSG